MQLNLEVFREGVIGVVHDGIIVIGDSNKVSRNFIKDVLKNSGFNVQEEAGNIPELLRKCRRIYPDLVIVDSDIEGGSLLEAADIIEGDNLGSLLFISKSSDSYFLRGYPHISKPFSADTLISVVEVSLYYRQKLGEVQKQANKLKEDLETRKLVDKAKGIIMKKYGMDEEEAYRWLQKESMKHGIPKREVARMLIIAQQKNKL